MQPSPRAVLRATGASALVVTAVMACPPTLNFGRTEGTAKLTYPSGVSAQRYVATFVVDESLLSTDWYPVQWSWAEVGFTVDADADAGPVPDDADALSLANVQVLHPCTGEVTLHDAGDGDAGPRASRGFAVEDAFKTCPPNADCVRGFAFDVVGELDAPVTLTLRAEGYVDFDTSQNLPHEDMRVEFEAVDAPAP